MSPTAWGSAPARPRIRGGCRPHTPAIGARGTTVRDPPEGGAWGCAPQIRRVGGCAPALDLAEFTFDGAGGLALLLVSAIFRGRTVGAGRAGIPGSAVDGLADLL